MRAPQVNGWIIGVDGCRFGWIAVRIHLPSRGLDWRVVQTAAELVALEDTSIVAIDVPIGLTEAGRAARAMTQHALTWAFLDGTAFSRLESVRLFMQQLAQGRVKLPLRPMGAG